jgi:hypothetical protein
MDLEEFMMLVIQQTEVTERDAIVAIWASVFKDMVFSAIYVSM